MTTLKLSTLHLYFVNISNIVPFLFLITKGVDGVGMALFYFFITACTHINDKYNQHPDAQPVDTNYLKFNLKHENSPKEGEIDICSILTFLALCFLILCGDIHPNPGPTNDSTLSIVHNNICSLQNKADLVFAELHNFDIITISETWLYDEFDIDKILIPGYSNPIRQDKADNSGFGGVATVSYTHLTLPTTVIV